MKRMMNNIYIYITRKQLQSTTGRVNHATIKYVSIFTKIKGSRRGRGRDKTAIKETADGGTIGKICLGRHSFGQLWFWPNVAIPQTVLLLEVFSLS